MRIAYISGAYIPDRGADSVHVMCMCQALAQAGHEVTLYVRPGAERTDDDFAFYGVDPCFRIRKLARPQVRVWGAIVNAWLAGNAATDDKPELIYARELYGLAVAARAGIPFIYELHWKPNHGFERALQSWLFRLPNMRRLVFISERLRDLYRRQFPWLTDSNLLVAHDAANPQAVGIPREPHERLSVGYVGGFLPGYGVEIVEQLARRRSDLDFHVVGGREPLVAEWREKTQGLTNLTFHGFVAPSELAAQYDNFDVVLAPYQATTRHIDWISPMKLFEYMAYGKAIVCADFPVMREVLTEGLDALLVPSADVAAYDAALVRLVDPMLRQQLGNAARAKLERDFTWRRRASLVLRGVY